MIDFTTVLINWNHAEETLKLVQQIESWSNIRSTVIIIDNASTLKDLQTLSTSSATLVKNAVNLGFGEALNQGLGMAFEQSDVAMVVNADVLLNEDAVTKLLWTLKSYPAAGIVGPLLAEKHNGKTLVSAGGKDIGSFQDTRTQCLPSAIPQSSGRPLEVNYVPGTCFLLKRQAFVETGTFDSSYFFSGEVADYCQQLARKGWKSMIDLQAQIEHLRTGRKGDLRKYMYNYYTLRNRFLYVKKNGGKSTLIWTMRGIRQIMGALLRFQSKRAKALFLAVLHGRKGIFGNQNHLFLRTRSD